jgi:tryptophan 2,3-dioxygenase
MYVHCAVFELWFKQILTELGSVMELLKDRLSLPKAVRRLARATQILEVGETFNGYRIFSIDSYYECVF